MLYVSPAWRTSSLFSTGRMTKYYGPSYNYVKRPLNNMIFRTADVWYQEMCVKHPGKKILVQVAGALDFILENFPENTVLIITGNELGDWGLTHHNRSIGPHGNKGIFKTNPFGTIILPPQVLPFFRQYYDAHQVAAFGDNVDFMPLGSRQEYPTLDPSTSKPASQRLAVAQLSSRD